MVLEEDTDGFAARAGHQLSLDCLLRDQTDGPAGLARGRVAANHSDNALLFRGAQQRNCARPRLFVKSAVQASRFITVSNRPYRLRRQLHQGSRCVRCGRTVTKMNQSQCAKDDSYRLHSTVQQFVKVLAVFTRNGYSNGAARHTPKDKLKHFPIQMSLSNQFKRSKT